MKKITCLLYVKFSLNLISNLRVFLLVVLFSISFVFAGSVMAENWYEIYRVNIGVENDQTFLDTSLNRGLTFYDGDTAAADQNSDEAKKELKRVCQKKNRGSVASVDCLTRASDKEAKGLFASPVLLGISLDTYPSYFGKSSFGYNIAFRYLELKSTLLDYPKKDEESELDLSLLIITPNLFYVLGDKALGKDGNFSFKISLGLSLPVVNKLELSRTETLEKSAYGIIPKIAYEFEVSAFYLFFKIGQSEVGFRTNFDGVEVDNIVARFNYVKFGFNYYL